MPSLSAFYPVTVSCKKVTQPCPCGYLGDPKRECRCSPNQVEKYRQRISGPLLDRIDIHVEAPAVEYRDLSSDERAEPSADIRARIEAARAVQGGRFANGRAKCNARISHNGLKTHCKLDSTGQEMLRMAMGELQLSARAYDRILKVSRTIADLAGSESIQSEHSLTGYSKSPSMVPLGFLHTPIQL